MSNYPRILYPADFDPFDLLDLEFVGAGEFDVQVDENTVAKIEFLGLERLHREVESRDKFGIPLHLKGEFVVMSSLSTEKIEAAVQYLYDHGYFTRPKD